MTLSPETLADLRRKAEEATWPDDSEPRDYEHFCKLISMQEVATPPVVLSLLDRIATLERELARLTPERFMNRRCVSETSWAMVCGWCEAPVTPTTLCPTGCERGEGKHPCATNKAAQ